VINHLPNFTIIFFYPEIMPIIPTYVVQHGFVDGNARNVEIHVVCFSTYNPSWLVAKVQRKYIRILNIPDHHSPDASVRHALSVITLAGGKPSAVDGNGEAGFLGKWIRNHHCRPGRKR